MVRLITLQRRTGESPRGTPTKAREVVAATMITSQRPSDSLIRHLGAFDNEKAVYDPSVNYEESHQGKPHRGSSSGRLEGPGSDHRFLQNINKDLRQRNGMIMGLRGAF